MSTIVYVITSFYASGGSAVEGVRLSRLGADAFLAKMKAENASDPEIHFRIEEFTADDEPDEESPYSS